MDRLTKEQRRRNMQAVKASNSKIESALAKALYAKGYRYRKNDNAVFGKPDITFRKYKIAVFVDSEFWHGKDWHVHKVDLKSNQQFWHTKIERNIERDKEVNSALTEQGWNILRFWGKDIENNLLLCIREIEEAIYKAKMNYSEKISLEEIKKVKISIESIDKEPEKKAVLTHYIHNQEESSYKKDALKAIKSVIEHYFPTRKVSDSIAQKALQNNLLITDSISFPTSPNNNFRFIDLFAGIGGFRLAFQNLGGKCVFSSEWDKDAQKTYQVNFGEVPFGDITKSEIKAYIPDNFDVLCAGFPCQAFSIAGKRGGFEDTRGTLFFDVAEIIRTKRPKAIFLENVKGLLNHDKGKTLSTILNVLREDLGYYVPDPQIINAKDFGVPQNRERIYIVGFRSDLNINEFSYPKPTNSSKRFADIKEENVVPTKYYLSTQYLQTLKDHKARHANKGNGFGYEIIEDNAIANAIVVGGMGRERNLVYDDRITDYTPTTKIKGEVNREGVRKMTPREWARLQGFPDSFVIPVADASAYKQFGNSVAVPAIQATAKELLLKLGLYVDRK